MNAMQAPLISVIVPVYAAERFLKTCVESVLQQTYQNIELILVDDESPDDSGNLCERYAAQDARVRVIHQKNKGTSGARNTGLAHARGEYLCFLDCDDFAHPELLSVLFALCQTQGTAMSMCSFEEAEEDATLAHIEKCASQEEQATIEMVDVFMYIERLCTPYQTLYVVPWGKLYHKSLFEGVEYPLATLNEDDCVIDALLQKAGSVAVRYVPLMYYRKNSQSISRKGIPAQPWLNSVPYKRKRIEYLAKMGKRALQYKVQRLFFYDLLLERARLVGEARVYRKAFYKEALRTYWGIVQNPCASKKETLTMLQWLACETQAMKHNHGEFLRNG